MSAAAVLAAGLASTAHAADRVYWSNINANKISFANLDASAGGNLSTVGAAVEVPAGVAFDLAAGRIYWANNGPDTISFANLNGSGGGNLSTTGATVNNPNGVAIDPAGGRIYWANHSASNISFANLNGSGGGNLNTSGATTSQPTGVAVDPAAGRLYWSSIFTDKISFANLNGTGGGDLTTTGATVADPVGVALDPAAGRIYWANSGGASISFANLNGSGGGNLNTTGATVNNPQGVALDPAAGRIYWANRGGNKISYANLNGTGGGDIPTLAATVDTPALPALFKAPVGEAPPQVAGGSAVGSALSCSQGAWATDLLPALLYRSPQSLAYGWSRDGLAIAGASASTYTATVPGEYRCTVTATNEAGAAAQTSAPHPILDGFGAKTLVTLKLSAARIPAGGPLAVAISNKNGFAVTGKLAGQTTKKIAAPKPSLIKLKAKSFQVAAGKTKIVKLTLPGTLRQVLERTHKLSLALSATIKDPSGQLRTVKKTVSPKLKTKPKR